MVSKAAITLAALLSAFSATAASIDRRIVGGEDARDGEFPFVVSITGTNGICGGALLDSTTVLTAASCLRGTVSVRAGSLQHRAGGKEAKIASRKPHPDYKLNKRNPALPYADNDIGIIKLSSPIEEGDKISYAKLAEDGSDPVVGSMATVAGWGQQEPTFALLGEAAEFMANVTIPIHAREVCAKMDADVGDRDTVICAGGKGKNACIYDGGSPLIDEKTKRVIGVTSWGIRDENGDFCGQAPMLFTRVGRYISFIHENMGGSPVDAKL
ncbi:peptidase S1 domain protein [Metarhizium robertsii]|uniref:Peptidase S1/S6, chymotrypsin/Hap n=2 Tax=Metarhizium robertsii TaxID=568076 RepID=E9ESU6_METRA|nr:Peptidase S1/S6, chymotrypsin/Hap [Metarhizium robertsii ARSEF 23]EFZ01969.1 Peptidase S1/S6, chymotrypsin/Hap [Metarhizium robertsii ARSEF 23]EXV02479.1 peptidase S1 domain protein [Metarhizium robertsii]